MKTTQLRSAIERILSRAVSDPALPASKAILAILILLARRGEANGHGLTVISHRTLAAEIGMSIPAVQVAVGRLLAARLIEVVRPGSGQRGHTYRVVFDDPDDVGGVDARQPTAIGMAA